MRMRQERKSLFKMQVWAGAPVRMRKISAMPQLCTDARSRYVPQILAMAFQTNAGQISTVPSTSLLLRKKRYLRLMVALTGTKSSMMTQRHTPSLQRLTRQMPDQFAYWSPKSCRTREGSSASMDTAQYRQGLVYLPLDRKVGSQVLTIFMSLWYILERRSNFSPYSWLSIFLLNMMVLSGGKRASTQLLPLDFCSEMQLSAYYSKHSAGLQGE